MSKEFEDLLGQYWDLAHLEGKSGVSQGDKANEVLHALKKLAEQPAQRKPLTREQVKDLLFEAGYVGAEESADFINGLRHGEAAHGIKENT